MAGCARMRCRVRRPATRRRRRTWLGRRQAAVRDLADVVGQPVARRAAEICAAGGHHLLLLGPPGVGKTMLAERMPTVMPALEPAGCAGGERDPLGGRGAAGRIGRC